MHNSFSEVWYLAQIVSQYPLTHPSLLRAGQTTTMPWSNEDPSGVWGRHGLSRQEAQSLGGYILII